MTGRMGIDTGAEMVPREGEPSEGATTERTWVAAVGS